MCHLEFSIPGVFHFVENCVVQAKMVVDLKEKEK
jgi:hypothetical protein